jgi:hypothetical protein
MNDDRKTIIGVDLAAGGDHSAVAMMRFGDGQEVRITALTISPPCKSWSDSGIDPLADVERWKRYMRDETGYSGSFIIPTHRANRIEHLIARATLSKRQYRRWRGRRKELCRNVH